MTFYDLLHIDRMQFLTNWVKYILFMFICSKLAVEWWYLWLLAYSLLTRRKGTTCSYSLKSWIIKSWNQILLTTTSTTQGWAGTSYTSFVMLKVFYWFPIPPYFLLMNYSYNWDPVYSEIITNNIFTINKCTIYFFQLNPIYSGLISTAFWNNIPNLNWLMYFCHKNILSI